MKLYFISLLLCFSFVGHSQTFEEYQKQQKNKFSDYKKKRKKEFNDFKDKRDKEFLEFVKTGWIKVKRKRSRPKKVDLPKPIAQPIYVPSIKQTDMDPVKIDKRDEVELKLNDIDKKVEGENEDITSINDSLVKESAQVESDSLNTTKAAIVTNKKVADPVDKIFSAKDVAVVGVVETAVEPLKIKKRPVPKRKVRDNIIKLDFYGSEVEVPFNKTIFVQLNGNTEDDVAEYWYNLSNSEYETMFNEIAQVVDDMKLNDWAYYLLLKKISEKIYTERQFNERNVFILFFMNKSGFKAKVARIKTKLYIILPFENTLYSRSFIPIDNKKYYFMHKIPKKSAIYTYKQDYPETERDVDLNLSKSISFGDETTTRELMFKYKGKENTFEIPYNKNNVDFYNDIPSSDLNVYFNATLSSDTKKALLLQLTEKVEGMNERDGVNYLLHFVQKVFEYKTDGDQFGKEKTFFAEELFYYEFSDCEDRSVLFSYLVKNIMKLDVVGVDFPGHIATAVKFNDKVEGFIVKYEDKDYIMCDPTYVNADVGMVMPNYAKSKIEGIILIK